MRSFHNDLGIPWSRRRAHSPPIETPRKATPNPSSLPPPPVVEPHPHNSQSRGSDLSVPATREASGVRRSTRVRRSRPNHTHVQDYEDEDPEGQRVIGWNELKLNSRRRNQSNSYMFLNMSRHLHSAAAAAGAVLHSTIMWTSLTMTARLISSVQ